MSTGRLTLGAVKRQPLLKALERHQKFSAKLGKAPEGMFAKSDTRGSLYIYDIIGQDFWTGGGVTADAVQKALAKLQGVKALDIFINSPGGDIFEGKAIYADLKRFDAEKVVHVQGLAASAASFIAMAGDTIKTAKFADWMVHEGSAFAYGWAEDLRTTAELLDKQNQDMAEIYSRRTGRPAAEMMALMSAETWMSAEEALAQKFTDEVVDEDAQEEPARKTAAANSRLFVAASNTEMNVRLARQARRLEQLSRPGQPGGQSPTGKP